MDYDLVIIGGGPAGLSAGICAVQRKLRTAVIEAGAAGGQPGTLYPEKEIHSFPCTRTVTGKDISRSFVEHAVSKGCVIRENETAEDIIDVPDGLRIVTDKGSCTARAVIVATGNGLLSPKKLDRPGVSEFEGRGVHYMMPPKKDFAGKSAMFVGGGHSALEMALMVCDTADTCIVHRGERFRADQFIIDRVKDSGIRTFMNAELQKVVGTGKVEKVLMVVNGSEEEIVVDLVIIKIGNTPEPERLRLWGLDVEDGGIKVDPQMRTSRKAVFACGDAVSYPGKYRQIVTGSSEGAVAVNSVIEYLRSL